jgi:hypothetical protein
MLPTHCYNQVHYSLRSNRIIVRHEASSSSVKYMCIRSRSAECQHVRMYLSLLVVLFYPLYFVHECTTAPTITSYMRNAIEYVHVLLCSYSAMTYTSFAALFSSAAANVLPLSCATTAAVLPSRFTACRLTPALISKHNTDAG